MSSILDDRRKKSRLPVNEDAYVVTSGKIGNIIDINMDGLSFRYTNLNDEAEEGGKLDILFQGKLILQDVPCHKVSERLIENKFITSRLETKRCSVQFESLSASQALALKDFLKVIEKAA